VNLIAIKRAEGNTVTDNEEADIINVPLPKTVVHTGDTLMIAGSDDDIARLPQE
jgi:trk system potassium uptake protein TrkA